MMLSISLVVMRLSVSISAVRKLRMDLGAGIISIYISGTGTRVKYSLVVEMIPSL